MTGLQICKCDSTQPEAMIISDPDCESTADTTSIWVKAPCYTLHTSDRVLILSNCGELNDRIFDAGQILISAEFHISPD